MRSLWVGRSQDLPMAQRVKDAGGSEGEAVIASIRVQNLPGVKTNRLPAGVSPRGNRRNNFDLGKQMTAVIPAGAPRNGNVGLLPVGIVKSAQMGWRVPLSRSAFEMLERYAVKVARTVLRRGSGSNATSLSDHRTAGGLRVF
jgi:hypothetical protein